MRKVAAGLISLALATGTAVAMGTPSSAAVPGVDDVGPSVTPSSADAADHDLPNPLEDKRRELREQAITAVINGELTPQTINGSTVVKVGEASQAPAGAAADSPVAATAKKNGNGNVDQYVELSNERVDRVFTLLVEFGNERDPAYPDQDTDPATPGPLRFDGPLHNEIPEPDRTVDNSTIWEPDFSQEYFDGLYFGTDQESLKTYYEKQSSGRYTVEGTTTDWVKVAFNEARYGRSNGFPCADIVCNNTWALVEDGMEAWVADRKAAGLSDAEVAAELATFDVYDRYDFNGNGDFNEPDGYVDHLQIVHSGGDQADGDPYQGEDAIWSHRWYAYVTDAGETGPEYNKLGGTAVGDTGLWAGDYTIQPENGGLSTIAHEYGHDLGLPDHYDTNGGQNGIDWWTLMAQSRLSGEGEPIGTRAGDLSAWDKLQLGWLDYEVVVAGQRQKLELGPHEYNSDKAQAAIVVLPKKTVTDEYVTPFEGENMWWSDKGDNLNNTLTRDLDLTAAADAELTFKANYDIEAGYDYLYVEASLDGGATWAALDGTVDGEPFGDDGSKPAIDGSTEGEWVDVVVPLDAAVGQAVQWRYRYFTDGGVAPDGFFADNISVTADGAEVFADGAEEGEGDWVVDGFRITTGTETSDFDNYYIASNRSYVSFDQYLKTGPYNFGFAPDRPDFVEHFAYQQGLLVSYWDTSQSDNNTSQHPGEALVMQIDAHPKAIYNLTGAPWRARIQTYDSPFSTKKADSFTLHVNSQPSYIRGQAANPVFDDTKSYRNSALPQVGVDLPAAGVKIRVLEEKGTSMTIRIN